MRTEVRNRVSMLKSLVTAEVSAPSGYRRWLMVQPNEEGGVMLVRFDVRSELDPDSWPAPSDVLNWKQDDFSTLDEAIAYLHSCDIDTDTFDAPWKMDYPL